MAAFCADSGLIRCYSEILLLDSDSDEEVSLRATFKSSVDAEKLRQPILLLDSDSDEEVSLHATFKSSVDAGKLRQPILQGGLQVFSLDDLGKVDSKLSGKVDKHTESLSQGDLRDKAVSLDEVGIGSSKFSGMLDTLRESVSQGGILGKDPCVDGAGMMKEGNEGTCNDYLQTTCGSEKLSDCAAEGLKVLAPALVGMRKCSLGRSPADLCVREQEKTRSSPVEPGFHDLTGDDDGCSSDPEWLRRDDNPVSPRGSWSSGDSVPHTCRDGELPERSLPNLGGNGGLSHNCRDGKLPEQSLPNLGGNGGLSSDRSEDKKRPLQNLPGFESHENERVEKRRSAPVQAAILDLTSDDDGCGSDLSWMRDYHPVPLRGSLNSGGPCAPDVRGREQFLPTSIGNSTDTASRRRPSLQIPGLESPENCETTISSSMKNLESGEDAPRRKRGRARKVPVSEEERAAKEAEKQRERELKKARQEEDKRAREEKKEELKRQKEAAKVDAVERRRLEKEENKWKKGKFALQNTTVHLDTKVVEMNEVGFLILQQLEAKKYTKTVCSNPVPQTIIWKMKRPSADSPVDAEGLGSQADDVINSQVSTSQLTLEEVEMHYVVAVFQGEEFAEMVAKKELDAHLSKIRKYHPTYSVCFLISGLKKHLQRKEQLQYKTGNQSWTRPNVEQVLAEFITHHLGVNSRLCIDASEIADYVVGLTRSLAECPFKQKLTSISVRANGEHVSKGDPDKDVIKKSPWLKFLVAIEGVNGAIAIAIAKQYPTMRALLNAYLEPNSTVLYKEKLLQDLVKDNSDTRKVGPAISRRIYRILMAKDANLSTKDVEEGADHFSHEQ